MPEPEPDELRRAAEHVLQSVWESTGYDFRHYQSAFVLRRLGRIADSHEMSGGVLGLAARIGEEGALAREVIEALSLGVTEMFRDPPFWRSLRQVLHNSRPEHGVLRCWVAGCASGEEAYSLSILLREIGYERRYLIYATDINEALLASARTCGIGRGDMVEAETNYRSAGGTGRLDSYFAGGSKGPGSVCGESIVFARHSLVTDAVFNSFHLVMCRNVMIYFDSHLHRRVHELLFESLMPGGILGLGAREAVSASPHAGGYQVVDAAHRIYRRRP